MFHFLVIFGFFVGLMPVGLASAQTPSVSLPPTVVLSSSSSLGEQEENRQIPAAVVNYVQMALQRHPELLQAEAQSRAQEEQFKEAKAQFKPRVVVGGNTGQESQRLNAANVSNSYKQAQAYLRMTMPLLDQGLEAQAEQRRQSSIGADWKLVDKREELMLRTLEAYVEILRASQLLVLAQDNLSMHRGYVKQVKGIAKLDLGRAADLPAAMSRASLAESVMTSRLMRLEQARLEFQSLTGLPKVHDLPELRVLTPAASLEEAYQKALNASPALQVARADVEQAQQGIALAKAPYRPRVNLDATGKTGRDFNGIHGKQSDLYLGVQAEWTVWAGGAAAHALNAATSTQMATRFAFEKARDELQQRVGSAWYEFLAHTQSLASFDEYVNHAQEMVYANRKQFRIGRRNLLDVLNAENELFTAKSNKMSSEMDQIKASFRLMGLQGLLPTVLQL
ncbi:TolC family protein [Limnohabitans sp. DM1]|uniref:TolC family protein n=1 Tax=Limnohabitans sp. DM1 TaxID=1597955 RepID=UPI001892B6D7|nr:TolC family protein [Limnohabitans sp. DM1]